MTDAAVRIGELARRTGVSPELLRAWEHRYGLLAPQRSNGGFRLYTAADEARVRRMTELLGEGVSAAEAARQALALPTLPAAVPPPVVDDLRERLRVAVDAFDSEGAHAVMDRLLASVSVETIVADVVIPYLRDVGDRWAAGRMTVAQEHFAANLLRGRLLGLARDWGAGSGPLAVLASLPGEQHDLALVLFGLLLGRRGWRITFLGADTPFDTVDACVRALRPEAVVLATVSADRFRACADDIRDVAWRTKLVVAAPVDEQEVTAVGARLLTAGIVDSVRTLAA